MLLRSLFYGQPHAAGRRKWVQSWGVIPSPGVLRMLSQPFTALLRVSGMSNVKVWKAALLVWRTSAMYDC